MTRLDDRIARDLRQIAERSTVSPTAWSRIRSRVADTEVKSAPVIEFEVSDRRPPRRWPLATAAAALVVTGGVILALGRGDGDRNAEPAPTTETAPADVRSTAEILANLVGAVETGDPDTVIDMLSPESDCDVPGPGSPVESCGQQVAYMLAIGGRLEARCGERDLDSCSLWHTTAAHAAMGYADEWLPLPFVIDGDGLVALRLREIPVRAYVGSDADTGRLWAQLREMRPDLRVTNFGPEPNDAESGAAVLAAAQQLNDPARIVAEFEADLDQRRLPSDPPRTCRVSLGTPRCRDLLEFLFALDADVDLACDTARDGTVPCTLTLTSELHEALGSEPTVMSADVSYRGGVIIALELDLRFSADPDANEAFFEYAMTADGLFRELGASGLVPVFTEESAPAWLDAATLFAADRNLPTT